MLAIIKLRICIFPPCWINSLLTETVLIQSPPQPCVWTVSTVIGHVCISVLYRTTVIIIFFVVDTFILIKAGRLFGWGCGYGYIEELINRVKLNSSLGWYTHSINSFLTSRFLSNHHPSNNNSSSDYSFYLENILSLLEIVSIRSPAWTPFIIKFSHQVSNMNLINSQSVL